jgi:ABC-2 type transport system permease protein
VTALSENPVSAPMVDPGHGGGLLDVVRRRHLLRLLVKKELRVRYWGSSLGLLWSYVKPAVQFVVFYFALGVFLQLNKAIEDFPIYLFSGVVLVNFFTETFGNATRSVVVNAPLVKKIFLPRELFPVASLIVAVIHFLPQLVVLVAAALLSGWRPGVQEIGYATLGFGIVALFALGLGLLFAALNVFFRDFENIVDLLLLVATWASPVLYPWTAVRDVFGDGWVLQLYLSNPLTVGVELFHRAFWAPGLTGPAELAPLASPALFAGCLVLALLILGQWVFARSEGRFAQEL